MASQIVESLKLVDKVHFPVFLLVLYSIVENCVEKPFSDSAPVVKQSRKMAHYAQENIFGDENGAL